MFVTMPLLMVLLVVGTIAQKYMGLYQAHQMFFSSFVFWVGFVPLPGGYLLSGILLVCLTVKFLFKSNWNKKQAGIILTHFGALVLLIGGVFTAVTAREGYMVIPEEQSAAVVEDYHARLLYISHNSSDIAAIPFDQLKAGHPLSLDTVPFGLIVRDVCRNCAPKPRVEDTSDSGLVYHGPAAKVRMEKIPLDPQDEANHAAVTLAVTGSDNPDQDGIYLLTERMPHYPTIVAQGEEYTLRFTRKRETLPFTLYLNDVEKISYPGTDTAREYISRLDIRDNGVSWPTVISMNEPLRYKGYTFYQSSYFVDENGETSVLAVVWNAGWLFPYIASIIMAAGMILHLVINIKKGERK